MPKYEMIQDESQLEIPQYIDEPKYVRNKSAGYGLFFLGWLVWIWLFLPLITLLLNGAGESVNVDVLESAMENNQLLLFVYPDGKVYVVNPSRIFDVHLDAKKFYPLGLFRSQDKVNDYEIAYSNGGVLNIHEMTCSFPVKLLERLY